MVLIIAISFPRYFLFHCFLLKAYKKLDRYPKPYFSPLHTKSPSKNHRKMIHNGSPSGGFMTGTKCKGLQDVIRNIYILRDVAKLISHIALVDGDVLVLEVRRIEGEVF